MNRHILKFFLTLPAAAIALASMFLEPAFGEGLLQFPIIRTIVISNQVAPGTSNARFNELILPTLNDYERAAFTANLKIGSGVTTATDSGIWAEYSNELVLIAREGSQAPGAPAGAVFNDLFGRHVWMNNAGQLTFTAPLKTGSGGVTTSNNSGIWAGTASSLSLIARTGDVAPGTGGLLYKEFFKHRDAAINSSGSIAFISTLSGNVTNANNQAIFSNRNGSVQVVASEGQPAPGAPGGPNFDFRFDNYSTIFPVMSESGSITFFTSLTNQKYGIWTSSPTGILSPIAIEGTQAPGLPAGAKFNDIVFPEINRHGHAAFRAGLEIGSGGVTAETADGAWKNVDNSITLIARSGSQAPGTPAGALFRNIGQPTINASGRTAFGAELVIGNGGVTTENFFGLWYEDAGQLSLIIRVGEWVPGLPNNTVLNGLISSPRIFDSGLIAFTGLLKEGTGGVTSSNNQGLWVRDTNGEISMILRSGDLFEVLPGDFRTISYLEASVNNSTLLELPPLYQNEGTISVQLSFTDGTQGLFAVTIVPEPSTWAMILCSTVGICLLAKYQRQSQIAA